jgi:hypothetical protein
MGSDVGSYHGVHTEWQLPLSGVLYNTVHSIMMEKLAQPEDEFMNVILRVLRFEVSVTMFTLQTSFKPLLLRLGGIH